MHMSQTPPSLSVIRKHLKIESVSVVSHCSLVAHPDFDLTMFTHCNLAVLILVLILQDQGKYVLLVHTYIQSQN